jgi:hypothetical protein
MVLNIERLNLEYLSWTIDNGEGRNSDDLRFGQFLHIKYNKELGTPDVFYVENATSAYETLLKHLTIS